MPLKNVSGIFIAFLLIASSFLPIVHAQTPTPLEKAQNDYNFQSGKYKDAHDQYATARSEYVSFKTAISKDNAYAKTKTYLVQVDLLYETFLAQVQENTNTLNWDNANVSKVETNNVILAEINFFKNNEKSAGQNGK